MPKYLKTNKACAEHFGVDARTLTNWKNEPGFPQRNASKGWDLNAIQGWLDERARKGSQLGEQSKQLALGLKALQVEEKELEVRRKRLEQEQREGNSLPRDEVTTAVREIITLTRDRFLGLPAVLTKFVPAEYQLAFRAEADAATEKILNEMFRSLEEVEDNA